MVRYIEDYEFLYQCIGLDGDNVILDVEDIIVNLIDWLIWSIIIDIILIVITL